MDRFAALVLGLGAALLTGALVQFWGANPGYADRFLVLIGAGWIAWQRRSLNGPSSPNPLVGMGLLLIGVVVVPVTIFLLVQIGPRTLLLWTLALGLQVSTLGWLIARQGWGATRRWLFPLFFVLFALPIPARVLNPLQDLLQEGTTRGALTVLTWLGYAVTREEFVLVLPGGKLLVEEACSGVRSITAMTALAAYLAGSRGFGWLRGTGLVLLAIPVIAGINVLRVVLSALIQERFGPAYLQGNYHEALGLAMVVVGLGMILTLARLLGRDTRPVESVPSSSQPGAAQGATAFLALGLIASLVGVGLGWVRESESAVTAPLEQVGYDLGPWHGRDLPVPAVVSDLLAPDQVLFRRYEDNLGSEAQVWVFFWRSGAAIKGYHHPDVCWGNRGFRPSDVWDARLTTPTGELPAMGREFRQGGERQVIVSWTQEGSRVWTEADEQAAAADLMATSWAGHRWVGDLLGATVAAPRISVVVVIPAARPASRVDARDLATRIAAEVARLCPWAAVTSSSH